MVGWIDDFHSLQIESVSTPSSLDGRVSLNLSDQ